MNREVGIINSTSIFGNSEWEEPDATLRVRFHVGHLPTRF